VLREKQKLLVLVGPTAVGKTKLSLEIASKLNCEIISGDSMQVYRGMDIGTAKASPEEQRIVPHHMIDIIDPDYPFSVAEFQARCRDLIGEIHARGRLPFIVGGTGLYVESVCYGFGFSEGGSDEAYREELRQYAASHGNEALHERLREVDPESAGRLHPNDQRRVIRALEVFHVSGKPLSDNLQGQTKQSEYQLCLIGLTMDRALLYKRIEERIDGMLQDGLVDEVKRLMDAGYTRELVSMQGLGYKEMAAFLDGEMDWNTAVETLKRSTRRFAKRQLSWFRHMQEIEWVDVTVTNFSAHCKEINDIIARKFPLWDHSKGDI
jgi:tRNA dimethylallyltransferase